MRHIEVKCYMCSHNTVMVSDVEVKKVCPTCIDAMTKADEDAFVVGQVMRKKYRRSLYDRENAARRREVMRNARKRARQRMMWVIGEMREPYQPNEEEET